MKIINVLVYLIYLFLIASLAIICIQPRIATAKAIDPVIILNYQEGALVPEFVVQGIIERYATGTKAYQLLRTAYCESRYYNIKSNLPEESYGIFQIHLPSHPTITKEQALDVDFAVKWASDNFANTKWYGYDRAGDHCN